MYFSVILILIFFTVFKIRFSLISFVRSLVSPFIFIRSYVRSLIHSLVLFFSCWGHVGHHGYKTQISIGDNCDFQHVMEHEIGHSFGFWHEQSRPDRDNYISVIWENVLDGMIIQ